MSRNKKVCQVCIFSSWLRGFSPGTPASSHVGYSKFPLYMVVSMNGCLSFNVDPVTSSSRAYPASHPKTGDTESNPLHLQDG